MENDFVWEDVRVTDDEVKDLIRYHQTRASSLKKQSQKHEARALELQTVIMPRTVAYTGSRS